MVEIKGSVINDSINTVKKKNGDQVYNNILSQLDEQARQLFEKPILDTGWYSLDSFSKFVELEIKLTANGDENELVIHSEDVIEKQLKGIYKIFVKLGSPEFILNRISILHQGYLRGVSIKIKLDGPDKAIITYTGFEKQHRLIGFGLVGFYKKAIEISGAKNIHTKFLTSIEENKGYCELEITWM
jgi:hypothetical protein